MSKQRSKLLEKAKNKFLNGFKCTKANTSSILEETVIDQEIEVNKNKEASLSKKFLEDYSILNNIKSKKRVCLIENSDDNEDDDSNISKLPILVLTPEKKRNKFSSTFVERPTIESFMTDDLTISSPTMSSIGCMETQISDSLITNDTTTVLGTEFAFSNVLYQSPVITQRFSQSLISEDLTKYNDSSQENSDLITDDFQSANSNLFNKLPNNSSEIFV